MRVSGLDFVDRGNVLEVHLTVPDQLRRRVRDGHRRHRDTEARMFHGAPEGDIDAHSDDANGGAGGEMRPGVALPGFPTDPKLVGGENDEEAPEAGGLQELYVDARSLQISGRDANGRNFSAMVYGPPPEGADPRGWPGGDGRGLMTGTTDFLPQSLRGYQRALDAHYRRR
jgi:hypothetical protein